MPGDPASLVFGLPNHVHRQRCEDVRGEVDQALAAHFGQPVALELVVNGTDFGASDGFDSGSPDDGLEGENIDLNSLTDADDVGGTIIERLTDAFPGSALIEQRDEQP